MTASHLVRVSCAAALALRFAPLAKATTGDLIAVLDALDLEEGHEARVQAMRGASVDCGWPVSEAHLRRISNATSGPVIPRMLERLRDLRFIDPRSTDGRMRTLPVFDHVVHDEADGKGRRGFVGAALSPEAVIGFSFDEGASHFTLDPRWLRGMTLPSAMLALRWLAVRHCGLEGGNGLLGGLAKVSGSYRRLAFRMTSRSLSLGFLGKCVVRETWRALSSSLRMVRLRGSSARRDPTSRRSDSGWKSSEGAPSRGTTSSRLR